MVKVVDQLDAYDPVASKLMSTQLINLLSMQIIITHVDGSDDFRYISTINSKRQDSTTPEELISGICIGRKTTARTFKATTHKYISTIGLLTKRFTNDKAHLRYKQLSQQYGTFYTDFLKVQITSIRGYCGGLYYTNKIIFKKFFPYKSDKGE